MTDEWHKDASCVGMPPDWWFPKRDGDNGHRALAICATCPVTVECLRYAVENHLYIGVWGGRSASQRQADRVAA